MHHLRVAQRLHRAQLRARSSCFPVRDRARSVIHRRSSSGSQRASFGPVGQVEERHDAEHDRRQPFENEQPAPAVQAEPVDAHQRRRDARAHHVRSRDGHHEHGHGLGAVFIAEPVRQVDDDAGEEAGLRDAEEETDPVELLGRVDEPAERGERTPHDEAQRDELARAPQLGDERRGNLQKEIPDEEDAGAEAEDGVREAEVAGHLQRGVADVDAVQVVEHVQHEEKRHQPADDVPARACGEVVRVAGGRHRPASYTWRVRDCSRLSRLAGGLTSLSRPMSSSGLSSLKQVLDSGARRPDGKARRPRIPGVFEGGATPPAGMPRPEGSTASAKTGH